MPKTILGVMHFALRGGELLEIAVKCELKNESCFNQCLYCKNLYPIVGLLIHFLLIES